MTASVLHSGGCAILCATLKSEVSIFLSHLGLLKVSLAGLQNQMLWGLVFPVQDPWAGSPMWGSDLSLL